MHKSFLVWAAALGALAVILGAFGAHKLKELVTPESVSVFQTGVTYQFYHVFALIATGILFAYLPASALEWAGRCFIIGIFLFSGSLYLITALKIGGNEIPKLIGILTPIGGVFFIAGWICLLSGLLKYKA
ncbi:Uncharacterized membrane protein YgdD, TMEM256/DUF423 family [Chitinophaga terrae (ex Kim and Jung 2007)]|jgi:uncharacterized membrane protein YgdD (TMEM256/DUF423 family)|uniref:Uncharacterized membrane protein YgdD, TMEM256/DUF423 family n=1 Tax=Chitinophaga terrae (ex Kim and Jung 2007) TaxID=408074 RepID=A0A1H3X083_9BACT|nr:DUF423 domain-containing protein [Chitinophaga terrae (ex Kim and Jung 2007)]MDQ0106952.1 uncharacterized membrane protein YgdD (TMEM256/DUF423 family) [Chitinophaga terrae (ex Kim and Jung 2007)]GEP90197.1 membrane protein [Chitinophaga terrae (ex Kim and Jung 2007)]SDZ92809.1 Uncharacterized membrane protein YgdD, TMEM256/DUF423 family [Chitinophaga terrae (ex Kim and Jung 2007)]